ncbi:hypothetical protein [Jiangella alkaliphila]|uniref:Uncharacterized protein n=1 Tax=Jiangella alkaliphila TaxID=419479 RepID=A0A1H2LPX5_9ACTN|nr:hypothetical protein [Jiangella alkaliphila]SDU82728.1 hypothetical protein SAMN04488563_6454 [Jiangella alkaliphila]
MPAPRSGPFAWSSFGDGYLVASAGEPGEPIIDLLLPSSDGTLRWVTAFGRGEVEWLADLTSSDSPASVRDGVAALEAALRALADGDAAAADDAVGAVDDLMRRLAQLRGELAMGSGPDAGAPSAASRLAAGPDDAHVLMTGPARSRAADRRFTTMGGLALALGIVALFWAALGVLLWLLLT